MKRSLRSIYGREVGTTDDFRLYARRGLVTGDYGDQFALGDFHQVTLFDDFVSATLASNWGVNKGSDGACANFACPAAGGASGIAVATTGAGAGASMAVNGVEITAALAFQAQTASGGGATAPTNNLEFNCKVKLSAITNVAIFVGFTSVLATTLQCPINGAGGGNGFTANANDAVGFLFDTAMTTADWWTIGAKGGVLTAGQDAGVAPVAATYDVLAVSIDQTGAASFYLNMTQVGVLVPASVTGNVLLTPVVAAFSRAAASRTVTLDRLYASMNRV